MSHEIVYAREFLKTKDGRIIPLVLMGSNNCWEFYNGRERPEKDWFAMLSKKGENPAVTPEELMKRVEAYVPSESQEHFVKNGKWVDDAAFVRFFKNGIKKAKTLEELNEEVLFGVQLHGKVTYYKERKVLSLYYKNIHSSDELDEFLLQAEKVVAENKDKHQCYIDLEFNERCKLERVRKSRTQKEFNKNKFYVITTGNGCVSKISCKNLFISNDLKK